MILIRGEKKTGKSIKRENWKKNNRKNRTEKKNRLNRLNFAKTEKTEPKPENPSQTGLNRFLPKKPNRTETGRFDPVSVRFRFFFQKKKIQFGYFF